MLLLDSQPVQMSPPMFILNLTTVTHYYYNLLKLIIRFIYLLLVLQKFTRKNDIFMFPDHAASSGNVPATSSGLAY